MTNQEKMKRVEEDQILYKRYSCTYIRIKQDNDNLLFTSLNNGDIISQFKIKSFFIQFISPSIYLESFSDLISQVF